MRALCVLVLFGGCFALPRVAREDGAEVIRVVDEKTPILLSAGTGDEENNVVPVIKIAGGNGTGPADAPASPSPVPENVAITTEQYVTPTPALVPSVVDISTVDPSNTPPPPANATAPASPPDDEDEEESDEGSEEEADEGDEEDEEEDEEDEEDEEESDDEEEEDDDAKAKRLALKKVVRRDVAGEEVPSSFKESVDGEGEKQSDEEDKPEKKDEVKKPVVKVEGSGLQSVPASGGSGEDDEAESQLRVSNGKVTSVIIS